MSLVFIQPVKRYLEYGLTLTMVDQEASAPSVELILTLRCPLLARLSTSKTAFG
jgi:hypothetical protein